jgi:hypothetical protein
MNSRSSVSPSPARPGLAAFPELEETVRRHLAYCRDRNWAGHDPYDALNSGLFKSIPALNSRIPRLIVTQLLKRSAINLRGLLRIPATQNPKALALFLSSVLRLHRLGFLPEGAELADKLLERLIALRSPGTDYWCWGYSFPWQGRKLIVDRGVSNLVCTLFVGRTLLEAYEARQDPRLLEMASSAGHYIVNDLYYTDGPEIASFSYPLPSIKTKVHNANLLAAAYLARLHHHAPDESFVEPAWRAARYSAGKQRADGSWAYGESQTQGWVDNFHTGYNLSGLREFNRYFDTDEFAPHIERGFRFYLDHFIRADGAARYFHDATYPIDIHCVAQTILTLMEFADHDPAACASRLRDVYRWTMRHMWDKRGFFYYRKLRTCRIRISYMRWSQAWMFQALSSLLEFVSEPAETSPLAATSASARS